MLGVPNIIVYYFLFTCQYKGRLLGVLCRVAEENKEAWNDFFKGKRAGE